MTDAEIDAARDADPDAAPELDEAWFASATLVLPEAPPRKRQTTLRLDPDIVDHFRAGGAGWQTRINAVLRRFVTAQQRRSR